MLAFYVQPYRLGWLLSLLAYTALSAQGQQLPSASAPAVRLGEITVTDLQTDPYPADPTAEAVVLYDYADIHVQLKGDELCVVSKYHVRTRIRRKAAYDRATVTRSLHRGYGGRNQFINDLEGYTYNIVNGAVVTSKLDKSGVFFEKMSDEVTLQKFTLPNVREGSVVEYTYTLYTPFSVAYNPDTWMFQQHVPVLWSELNVRIPNYCHYKIITSGYLPLAINENSPVTNAPLPGGSVEGAVQYRFAVKDAPAFRPEAYITTESDYLSKIEFELARYSFPSQGTRDIAMTWDALDATLLRRSDFGGQFRRAPFLGDVATLIKQQYPDSLSRIGAACACVSRTMKWNGNNGLLSDNIKKVWDARKGDAGEINLLLIGLLRELDFDANPVILSTRSHGRVDESFALIRKFNYVVAHVDVGGKDLLLDATDPGLKPGMLPRHCLNGTGRLVHFTKGRFVSLLPAERSVEVMVGAFTLDDGGTLSGSLSQSYGGYKGLEQRTAFLQNGREKYLNAVRQAKPAWQINRTAVVNADSIAMPFTVSHKLTIPDACQLAGERLYLRPMLTEGHPANVFKDPERRYPVDFGVPIDEVYTATITLPNGIEVDELPKSALISLPNNGGRFTYQVTAGDGEVKVVSRVSVRKPVYYAGEYPALREFYDKILAKHAELLVLKRAAVVGRK